MKPIILILVLQLVSASQSYGKATTKLHAKDRTTKYLIQTILAQSLQNQKTHCFEYDLTRWQENYIRKLKPDLDFAFEFKDGEALTNICLKFEGDKK